MGLERSVITTALLRRDENGREQVGKSSTVSISAFYYGKHEQERNNRERE